MSSKGNGKHFKKNKTRKKFKCNFDSICQFSCYQIIDIHNHFLKSHKNARQFSPENPRWKYVKVSEEVIDTSDKNEELLHWQRKGDNSDKEVRSLR